jgi:site-specific DNA recombinase
MRVIMAKIHFFQEEFNRHAINGFIGDPNGVDAYAYLRVSTDRQADEDQSGLPRQIEHVHEAAVREGCRVAYENVFADDESGFILERPELNRLLAVTGSMKIRRANVLIVEHIDRLSRNADWHQGWLLEQFQEVRSMKIIFWKQYNSRIERAVFGAIAMDGMQSQKERMRDGKMHKAKRGNVTASSKIAFGYRKADAIGDMLSTKARTDTHYIIYEPEAEIVRYIYEQLAYNGRSLRSLGLELAEKFKGTSGRNWDNNQIRQMIHNPVYKGLFVANRYGTNTVMVNDEFGRPKKVRHTYERPESEWIYVDVDPIVTPELWDMAIEATARNRITSSRNGKNKFLLTGLLKCASCGYAWNGFTVSHKNRPRKDGTYSEVSYYRCSSKMHSKSREAFYDKICDQTYQVRQDILETAVWSVVRDVLYQPDILLAHLDEGYSSEENRRISEQVNFLLGQIEKATKSDNRHREVMEAGGYTPQEFADLHNEFKARKAGWESDVEELSRKIITAEMVSSQKDRILAMTAQAKKYKLDMDAPYELKKTILKLMVWKIYLNLKDGWFKIEGELNGTWSFALDTEGENLSVNGEGVGKNGDIVISASQRYNHNTIQNVPYTVTYSLFSENITSAVVGKSIAPLSLPVSFSIVVNTD